MESLLEQFSERCPVAVMARLGLQRAVGAEWVEAVFAEHRGMQYTRELAFSTVVDLRALVAVGLQPSLHVAARKHPRPRRLDHLPLQQGLGGPRWHETTGEQGVRWGTVRPPTLPGHVDGTAFGRGPHVLAAEQRGR